jgi:hypothetical protein
MLRPLGLPSSPHAATEMPYEASGTESRCRVRNRPANGELHRRLRASVPPDRRRRPGRDRLLLAADEGFPELASHSQLYRAEDEGAGLCLTRSYGRAKVKPNLDHRLAPELALIPTLKP